MTSRQRVLATLNREPTDCIPFEIGGTDCSSVHVIAYKKLRKQMGLADGPIRVGCLIQLAAQADADVMDALDVDVEVLWFGSRETKVWKTPFGVDLIVSERFDVEDLPDGSSLVRSPQGVVYAKRAGSSTSRQGRTIARTLRRPYWLPVPEFALRLALGEKAMLVLDGQRVVPRRLLEEGFDFLHPTLDQTLAHLMGNS